MIEIGKRNPACGIAAMGMQTAGTVRYNLTPHALYEDAIRKGEAGLTAFGALWAGRWPSLAGVRGAGQGDGAAIQARRIR